MRLAATPQRNIKVLVFEDNAMDIAIVNTSFENKPFDFEFATSGGVGLEMAVNMSPDIIFLDLNMPVMDGWEVLRGLKADSRTRMIPVIVLTSSTNPDDVVRAYDMHAANYLTKPFDFDAAVELAEDMSLWWGRRVKLPRA